MPNTTPHARRCMIINYCQFWHKQFGEVANGAQRLLEAGRLHTPLRRQLLGIEVMETHSSQPGNSQAQPGTNRYSAEWVRKHEEQTGQIRGGAW